jgi:hypothetical protein
MTPLPFSAVKSADAKKGRIAVRAKREHPTGKAGETSMEKTTRFGYGHDNSRIAFDSVCNGRSNATGGHIGNGKTGCG